ALSVRRSSWRRRRREQERSIPEAWLDAIDCRLDASEIACSLAELPLEQREVIVARIWGGLGFEEIAVLMECSVATAHRRYLAGLERLRERFHNPCNPTSTT